MRRYETILILDPELSAEQRAPVVERIRETLSREGGTLVRIEEWGTRRLAYAIRKKERGWYARFDYCSGRNAVNEIERFCRIDERVLRFLTVLLDTRPNVERILEEASRAEIQAAAEAQASATPEAPAETAPPAEPAAVEPPRAEPAAGENAGPVASAEEA
ncbi:MAG: 30S ribosomal protein S6 [Desulfobacterales bacterium]